MLSYFIHLVSVGLEKANDWFLEIPLQTHYMAIYYRFFPVIVV